MDGIRDVVDEMQRSERQLIAVQTARWQNAATVSFAVTGGGSAVLLFLIATAATMASRDFRTRQLESWLRTGQIGLSACHTLRPQLFQRDAIRFSLVIDHYGNSSSVP